MTVTQNTLSHSFLSLRSLFLLLALVWTLFVVIVMVALNQASNAKESMAKAYEGRYQSLLLADELRQSSDDLTRFARTYVVTADPAFEAMFEEVLAIRNGLVPRPQDYHRIYWDFVAAGIDEPRPRTRAVPLQTLMREAGFSEMEFAKLREAQDNSDALVATEVIAMNAVKGLFDDGTGAFSVAGEPDLELARNLMHGPDYHTFKAAIMGPLDEFFVLLDERTSAEVAEAKGRAEQSAQLALGMSGFSLAVLIIALLLVYQMIQRQLGGEPVYARGVVQRIAAGNLGQEINIETSGEQSLLKAMHDMQQSLAQIIGGITEKSEQLAQAADRLAVNAGLKSIHLANQEHMPQSMASAVEQMSASVAEITSTMEELSASSTQIADHSRSVVDVANQTLDNSQRGQNAMQALQTRIAEIEVDNQKSLAEILTLGHKSKEISKVMDLINTVADQTKLIAFNAALEASSAGEAGRRFSVVAAEIRRLADSVTDSTREIESRVGEIQDAISRLVVTSEKGVASIAAGRDMSSQTAKMLADLVSAATRTSNAAQQISLSTQQQKTASTQVVVALREIAAAGATNSASLRDVSATSQELLEMSAALRDLVSRFRLARFQRNSQNSPPSLSPK